jgi:type I restriction enzyme M protein
MSNPQQLVQKLWNYCNILRDEGLSYGDYVEQLTFLLFGSLAPARSGLCPFVSQNPFRSLPSGSSLKMADEPARTPFNRQSPVPPSKKAFSGELATAAVLD